MTFRPPEHIRRRADFERAYEAGTRIAGRFMTIFIRRNTDGHARLGIAATRKIGGAVIRNRAKRLARELFRHQKPSEAFDIVVIRAVNFLMLHTQVSSVSSASSWSAPADRRRRAAAPAAPWL